jgi:hypothetical protein
MIESGQSDFGRKDPEFQISDELVLKKNLSKDDGVVIDVLGWLSKATLDIIGESECIVIFLLKPILNLFSSGFRIQLWRSG